MGHYLDALYQTGYYYTSIGVMQVTAAILLLVPRTTTLGAVIYFPIILNICILSVALRFQGSLFTAPLMVAANLYLLCWDYHKLRFILPGQKPTTHYDVPQWKDLSNRCPTLFVAGVAATVVAVVLVAVNAYDIMPWNTVSDCRAQCAGSDQPGACYAFCDCIHGEGNSLNNCLDAYYTAPSETVRRDIVKCCGSVISVIRRPPSDLPRCFAPAVPRQ